MKVLVTGAGGFIGSNVVQRLLEKERFQVLTMHRDWTPHELHEKCDQAEAVIHVAGVNRSNEDSEFVSVNELFTEKLLQSLSGRYRRKVPLIFSSTTQAGNDSIYGRTKITAERHLEHYALSTGSAAAIYRLPNVFGKWCKPNYNSVVATFCYNIAHDIPIKIHDERTQLNLVYIDDVVDEWCKWLQEPTSGLSWPTVKPQYDITVGKLASLIESFNRWRDRDPVGSVGSGLVRALYSTYISYLPLEDLSFPLEPHSDERGSFSEVIRTQLSGQVSYFTSKPGVKRGGHYHHTKIERFVVVRGRAFIRMTNIRSGSTHEIEVSGLKPVVVEMPPGWTHEIENIGDEEMLCFLWANELFDPLMQDTYSEPEL